MTLYIAISHMERKDFKLDKGLIGNISFWKKVEKKVASISFSNVPNAPVLEQTDRKLLEFKEIELVRHHFHSFTVSKYRATRKESQKEPKH
jgi:hypothetical protein